MTEQEDSDAKIYRIDWKYFDEDGVTEDYDYVGASTPEEAVGELAFDEEISEYTVREATQVEIEAFVAGYDNGYDSAKALYFIENISKDNWVEVSLSDLDPEDDKFDEIVKDINLDTNPERD